MRGGIHGIALLEECDEILSPSMHRQLSAECKTVCTQPTCIFCKLLRTSTLQIHGIGRHFKFVHSADMRFL